MGEDCGHPSQLRLRKQRGYGKASSNSNDGLRQGAARAVFDRHAHQHALARVGVVPRPSGNATDDH